MALLYQKNPDGITLTGHKGEVSFLQVPDKIEGLPVCRVAKSAFARRPDLRYVKLPESLQCLERFAFFSCPSLERVVMEGGIAELGDGVFRQCGRLRELELNLTSGGAAVLRELLADIDRTLRVRVLLPAGEAVLTFPEYLLEFVEDTWARALHTQIEGAGFAYRECVRREGIDFREYDKTFPRISRTDPALAAQIALDRLQFPLGLEASAGRAYEAFLFAEGERVVRQVIREKREGWLLLLTQRKLLTPEALRIGIREASQAGAPSMVSILMNSLSKTGKGKRFQL